MRDGQARLILLIEELSGRRGVRLDDRLNFDLGVEGDDARDLIEAVYREFGTSFVGMEMRKFFKDEGFEAVFRLWRMGKAPLSVRHLAEVVEKGRWFEPDDGQADPPQSPIGP